MDSKSITCNITSRYIYIIYCSSQQKKKYIYCPIRNVSFEEILLQLEIGDHGIPSFSIPFPQQTKKQVIVFQFCLALGIMRRLVFLYIKSACVSIVNHKRETNREREQAA